MSKPLLNIEVHIGRAKTVPIGGLTEDLCYRARKQCDELQERLSEALAELEVELGTTRIAKVAYLPYGRVEELIGHLPVSQFR